MNPGPDPFWDLQERIARRQRLVTGLFRLSIVLIAVGLVLAAAAALARGGL
jgi:hypothetical protein